MNEAILFTLFVVSLINVLALLLGLAEWVIYHVILQEESPKNFYKWQKFKYDKFSKVKDGDVPFTILFDIVLPFLVIVVGGMLEMLGLLAPLVFTIMLVIGARQYVAYTKAKKES